MGHAADTEQKRSPPEEGRTEPEHTTRGGLAGSAAFLWPAIMVAEAGRMASAFAREMADFATSAAPGTGVLPWTTANTVALQLRTMELRDFSTAPIGVPTLVCAPFALHRAGIADLAPGHSLIDCLRRHGIERLYLTDWRSATPEMRFLSIDDYLADLNVAVDDLGGCADLIGICQGGWMGLLYAARFPSKVRRLVIAGGPVDIAAADSSISALAKTVPLSAFADLAELGQGRIIGERALDVWGARDPGPSLIREALQPADDRPPTARAAAARFRRWNAITYDLPGTYYRQVVEWLFRENRLAEGRFVALGRTVDLGAVKTPIFLLAAKDDEVVAPGQVLGAERLLGTESREVGRAIVPGPHLSLFMGARTLATVWPRIVRWLRRKPPERPPSAAPALPTRRRR